MVSFTVYCILNCSHLILFCRLRNWEPPKLWGPLAVGQSAPPLIRHCLYYYVTRGFPILLSPCHNSSLPWICVATHARSRLHHELIHLERSAHVQASRTNPAVFLRQPLRHRVATLNQPCFPQMATTQFRLAAPLRTPPPLIPIPLTAVVSHTGNSSASAAAEVRTPPVRPARRVSGCFRRPP